MIWRLTLKIFSNKDVLSMNFCDNEEWEDVFSRIMKSKVEDVCIENMINQLKIMTEGFSSFEFKFQIKKLVVIANKYTMLWERKEEYNDYEVIAINIFPHFSGKTEFDDVSSILKGMGITELQCCLGPVRIGESSKMKNLSRLKKINNLYHHYDVPYECFHGSFLEVDSL